MEPFNKNIQTWVILDNQIKQLNDKIRDLRKSRSSVCDEIINYVEQRDLNSSIVQISDGTLRFTERKQTPPLTFKYIESCLERCIKNSQDVKAIMKYIKESRNITNTLDIKRLYKEPTNNDI